MTSHTHRYILTPMKAEANGRCKRCGYERRFTGGLDETNLGSYERLTGTLRTEAVEALRDARRLTE